MSLLSQTQWLNSATVLLVLLLVAISWIDLQHMIIPNVLNATLAITGILVSVLSLHTAFLSIVLQSVSVVALFWRIAQLYSHFRKVDGLGGGDIKFLGAATCWVGAFGLPWALLIASLSGLTLALCRHLMGHRLKAAQRLAFGPHLSLGLFVTWMMRDAIFNFPT